MKKLFDVSILLSLILAFASCTPDMSVYNLSIGLYNGTDIDIVYERYFPAHNFPESTRMNYTDRSDHKIRYDEIPSEDYCGSGDWSTLVWMDRIETENGIPDEFFTDYLEYACTFVEEPRLVLYRASDRKELLNCRLDELDKYFRVVNRKTQGGEKPSLTAHVNIYLEGLPEEAE